MNVLMLRNSSSKMITAYLTKKNQLLDDIIKYKNILYLVLDSSVRFFPPNLLYAFRVANPINTIIQRNFGVVNIDLLRSFLSLFFVRFIESRRAASILLIL